MTECEVWFNSACSTCRKTEALLKEKQLLIQYVHYLDKPPSETRILEVLSLLDTPASLVRTKEVSYKESGLTAASDSAAIASALAKDSRLIQRPVVIFGDSAVVARPPEAVLPFLNKQATT